MAELPLTPLHPDISGNVTAVSNAPVTFRSGLNANIAAVEDKAQLAVCAVEKLQAAIGNAHLSGGDFHAGTGLSVHAAALTALVGTWVGFDAEQTVGGLTDNDDNYIFLRQDGTWTVNLTGAAPADTATHGAYLLWGTALTASGAVTAIDNTRTTLTDLVVTKDYVDLAISSLKLDEYFSDVASDQAGSIDYVMDSTPASAGTVVSAAITSSTTTNIFNFYTPVAHPHLDRLVAGNYDIHAHLLKTGNRTINVYCELWVLGGGAALGTSATTTALTASDAFYDLYINLPAEVTITTTDRLELKWYAISTGPAGNTTVTMTVGGTADPHMSVNVSSLELDQTLVPYTGATHNVDLGAKILKAAQVVIGTDATETAGAIKYATNHFYGWNGSTWLQLDNAP
jgi:hypothetical protein